jgi:hypothetical protein
MGGALTEALHSLIVGNPRSTTVRTQQTEEFVIAQLKRLPEDQRRRLLGELTARLDQLLQEPRKSTPTMAHQVVEQTWGSLTVSADTLRWVAENKALEYPR